MRCACTAGFREEVAAAEVALYRDAATRARAALDACATLPADSDAKAVLGTSLARLHFRRPFFSMPMAPQPEVSQGPHTRACMHARTSWRCWEWL